MKQPELLEFLKMQDRSLTDIVLGILLNTGAASLFSTQHSHIGWMQSDSDLLYSEKIFLPAVIAQNARTVQERFWIKLLKTAGRIPFAEELASTWYCVSDPATPARAKAILLAALAYFVAPVDAIPDFVAGIGFTDDAAVLAMAISLVSSNIKPQHREKARLALGLPRGDRSG